MLYSLTRIALLLLLLFPAVNLCGQWVRLQHPDYLGLEELYFIDQFNGVAVGHDDMSSIDGGRIWRTADGGQSWQMVLQDARPYHWLEGVDFADAQTGVAVGRWDIYYRTTDGGWTWDSVPHPGESVLHETVEMVDQNIGYAGNYRGEVLKTTDGGLNWVVQYTLNSVWYPVTDIKCLNADDCWLTGWGGTYLTSDGGQNWQRVSALEMVDMHCWDASNCIGLEGNRGAPGYRLFRTYDAGATWDTIAMPAQVPLLCMDMIGNNGFVGGADETIFETNDMGQNWSIVHSRPSSGWRGIRSIMMLDATHAYACGDSGAFLRLGMPTGGGKIADEVAHTIYPNPVLTTTRFVFSKLLKKGAFHLYDSRGRLIQVMEVPEGTEFRLDASGLPAGVYTYCFLENKTPVMGGKMLKQ